jgi:ABC-type multidrug transport system fused ATPase/permease subunit
VPLRKIRSSSYYDQAAVVLQDTEVFNLPLKENITIAQVSGGEDKKRLAQAVKIAHVDDFIGRLPQGVETPVGEKGIRLSGGEKQRVGIARAIYKQPQILFLDEATSHLDLESEEKIRDSLGKFFRTVTAVVIAHRLTTIRQMDRILVMEGGRIIESGTFEELQAKEGGRFRELWDKQNL